MTFQSDLDKILSMDDAEFNEHLAESYKNTAQGWDELAQEYQHDYAKSADFETSINLRQSSKRCRRKAYQAGVRSREYSDRAKRGDL